MVLHMKVRGKRSRRTQRVMAPKGAVWWMATRCVRQTEALNLAGGVWPNGAITGIWIRCAWVLCSLAMPPHIAYFLPCGKRFLFRLVYIVWMDRTTEIHDNAWQCRYVSADLKTVEMLRLFTLQLSISWGFDFQSCVVTMLCSRSA